MLCYSVVYLFKLKYAKEQYNSQDCWKGVSIQSKRNPSFYSREVELLVDLVPAQQCLLSSFSLKRQLFVKVIRPVELLAWETRS